MYTRTDQSQFQAHAIQEGRHQLAAMHREIMDWVTEQFDVHALDFSCETRTVSNGSPQQLVHVILETAEDVKRVHSNRDDQLKIGERFLTYFQTEAVQNMDRLKDTTLDFDNTPFPEIIVTYRPLKALDSKVVNEMLDDEVRAVLKTFESVWTVSMSVIFYYTDVQLKENEANGTSAKINATLEPVSKKYGFTFTPYRFDSKETFDRDYESNWYYYWK